MRVRLVASIVLAATLAATAGLARAGHAGSDVCSASPPAGRLVVVRTGSAPVHPQFTFRAWTAGRSPALVREVVRALCALPRFPEGVFHCPFDSTLRYRLELGSARREFPVVADPSGCEAVRGAGPVRQARPSFWRALGRAIGLRAATDQTFAGSP
jgi:hypothetical protein